MSQTTTGTGKLGPIACITVTAPNLADVEAMYTRYLEHRVIGRGTIDPDLASLWQAPAVGGRPYLLLSPSAGEECIFRFIEADTDHDYVPFSTFGWNAAEIMVEDVDNMAERLHGSPFEIVGEPQNLSFSDDIRAMQILGPGKELLYLTEFKKQLPGFDTPIARCPVDRVFIVILGGPSMDGLQSFFGNSFGVPGADPVDSRVKGMSAAFGNSPEHLYPIAALPLAGQTLIEVDEMPPQASARPAGDGDLPAGISMVSFVGRGIDSGHTLSVQTDQAPYRNIERASCHIGSACERIEILHV
jgi:hypothetical protein